MIRLASLLKPAWFLWLPAPALRTLIASSLVFDAALNTLWLPFRAVGLAVMEAVFLVLEGLHEAWSFWIPCTCADWDSFKRSLPSRDGVKTPEGPDPDCDFCHGRGGIGLWTACGRVAKKFKEDDR